MPGTALPDLGSTKFVGENSFKYKPFSSSSNLTTLTVQDTDLIMTPVHWAHDEYLLSVFTKFYDVLETLEVVGRDRAPQKRVSSRRYRKAAARAMVAKKAARKKSAKEKAAGYGQGQGQGRNGVLR